MGTADQLAECAHHCQVDKIGRPYIGHPRRVAAQAQSPEAKASALLHDVIEDSSVTAEDLRAHGIPARLALIAEPTRTELRAEYRWGYTSLGRPELAVGL